MIEKPELENYLPHKDSMLLLDRIMSWNFDKQLLESEVDTRNNSLFFNEELDGIPAWVGFEYMAQSIAALSGLDARHNLEQEPCVGFIMSVRNYATTMPAYPVNKVLRIQITQLFNEDSVVSFDCAIIMDGKIVSTAIVNAIETDEPEKFWERYHERKTDCVSYWSKQGNWASNCTISRAFRF